MQKYLSQKIVTKNHHKYSSHKIVTKSRRKNLSLKGPQGTTKIIKVNKKGTQISVPRSSACPASDDDLKKQNPVPPKLSTGLSI